MEEKAPQEKCLETLKHVASANLAMSVVMANNTWYSLYVVQLEQWMPLQSITKDPRYEFKSEKQAGKKKKQPYLHAPK